jgi:hypothetical protein
MVAKSTISKPVAGEAEVMWGLRQNAVQCTKRRFSAVDSSVESWRPTRNRFTNTSPADAITAAGAEPASPFAVGLEDSTRSTVYGLALTRRR